MHIPGSNVSRCLQNLFLPPQKKKLLAGYGACVVIAIPTKPGINRVCQNLYVCMCVNVLQVLDVGHNELMNVSVTNLMASQISLLDMSLNTQLRVDPREYKAVK